MLNALDVFGLIIFFILYLVTITFLQIYLILYIYLIREQTKPCFLYIINLLTSAFSNIGKIILRKL